MASLDSLLAHFAEQARHCHDYGSPFTGHLIDAMQSDLEAGGPVADLVTGWPGSPRADAVAIRLAGSLHAAALSGRDAALAAEYPAARPDWGAAAVWQAARAFLERDHGWVAAFLRSPPQTNETRRSIALLAGFLHLADRFALPLALLEIGASAGMNQYWDRFAYRTASWQWGGPSPCVIDTDWRGPPPPLDAPIRVETRAACDQNPPDVRAPEDRLRLRAYVWADQPERLARFDAAAELAVANGVAVERADAAEWLERRLPLRSRDALTVVYHSVFLQYPPRETRDRITAAIERAGETGPAPLAWLRLEPEVVLGGPRDSLRFLVDVVTWPGAERRTLAATDGHVRSVSVLDA
ncbi:MAG: DUF2332 domain-containing protein [Myxococcota bacterium]